MYALKKTCFLLLVSGLFFSCQLREPSVDGAKEKLIFLPYNLLMTAVEAENHYVLSTALETNDSTSLNAILQLNESGDFQEQAQLEVKGSVNAFEVIQGEFYLLTEELNEEESGKPKFLGKPEFLVKYGAKGQLLWRKTLGRQCQERPSFIKRYQDSLCFLASSSTNSYEIQLVDAKGELLRTFNVPKELEAGLDVESRITDLAIGEENNIYLAVSEHYQDRMLTNKFSLLKLNQEGRLEWKKDYPELKSKGCIYEHYLHRISYANGQIVSYNQNLGMITIDQKGQIKENRLLQKSKLGCFPLALSALSDTTYILAYQKAGDFYYNSFGSDEISLPPSKKISGETRDARGRPFIFHFPTENKLLIICPFNAHVQEEPAYIIREIENY
ncbi:hypothetical protein [Saprospira grandis]|uniref:hypothetical protein n=1 Tax=Saprospira grandis TaxID=1008 RepID=UPI0022DDDB3D|nr:hypothetical protein [Saprospira grandis]WBM74654.1 hypothetical protein OP864_00160 [Saprospira grandis]